METGSKKTKKKAQRKVRKRRKKVPMTWARKICNWNSGIRKRGSEIKITADMEMPEACVYCNEDITPKNASLDHNIHYKEEGKITLITMISYAFPVTDPKEL